MDDFNLTGKIQVVASDIDMIVTDATRTGIQLNLAKCEIIAPNFSEIEKYPIFKDFKRLRKEDLTILGASILKGPDVDKALADKILELERATGRLSLLQAQNALCLFHNALAMPKLLYILRTAPCTGNKILKVYDDTLHKRLTSILNLGISDNQWIQASLPVHLGSLEVRSAESWYLLLSYPRPL